MYWGRSSQMRAPVKGPRWHADPLAETNHRISVASRKRDPLTAAHELVHLNPPGKPGPNDLPALTLFQAYGELMDKQPAFEERYTILLEQLRKDQPNNPLVLAAYGRKLLRDSSPQVDPRAIEALSQALASGSTAPSTFQDLGDALSRAGRIEEAVKTLEQGIAIAPYAAVLYKSLTSRLIALKQHERAYQTMKRYVELFPEDSFMRGILQKAEQLAR